jgi:hypothetical protein
VPAPQQFLLPFARPIQADVDYRAHPASPLRAVAAIGSTRPRWILPPTSVQTERAFRWALGLAVELP